MSVVAILHSDKPNKLTAAANRADTPWFAANPDRLHYVRRTLPIERQQAGCIHGRPGLLQEWFIAARRAGCCVIERRFLPMAVDASLNLDERTAEWLFDGALIAGAAPQRAVETEGAA
ncbi:hypothetical protein P7D22_19710 [Lichenihabitans sp. Uapishka_5]|uniref:hypothetical protein n=1 Tax=Lichenihabitans sp. Uapishka_5 TaxID=3037302 RepID=UPI0029E7CE8B|nr:hypothetical protein [Lichenihabitans sp. Uapishka_5]MDX7953395.1 hypothetical protein [Lichenihabitans sp. Uapishka_5]